MDKYGTDEDPLCYPDSNVLINHLDIYDQNELDQAETEITDFTASEIEFSLPPYDLSYLRQIHKTLFSDIYYWAGQLRQIDISKGNTHFCHARYIEGESNKLFQNLKNQNCFEGLERDLLVKNIAEFYGDVNMLHPFREGNGRAQRILFEHIIVNAGYEISWESIQKDEWIQANIAAVFCDYTLLERIFDKCIGNEIDE